MVRAGCLIVTLLTLLAPRSVAAQSSVRLAIENGRVSLQATQAPLSAILAEWARVGQLTMVNADTLSGGPVTIELHDMTEQQALQVLLRSTGGFVAVPRSLDTAGPSAFARIVILPTTVPTSSGSFARTMYTPPPAAAPALVTPQQIATQTPGVTRLVGANGLPVPDDQDGTPPPGITRAPAGYVSGGDPPPAPQPAMKAVPPTQTLPTRVPSGTIGSAAPGVITPVPQAAPPSSPAPTYNSGSPQR